MANYYYEKACSTITQLVVHSVDWFSEFHFGIPSVRGWTKGGIRRGSNHPLVPARFRRNSVEKSSGKARWKSPFIGPRYFDASLNTFKRPLSLTPSRAREIRSRLDNTDTSQWPACFLGSCRLRYSFGISRTIPIQSRPADELTGNLVRILRWMPRLFHVTRTTISRWRRNVSFLGILAHVVSRSCRQCTRKKKLDPRYHRILFHVSISSLTRTIVMNGGRRWPAIQFAGSTVVTRFV